MQLARIFIRKISHLKNTLKFASKKSVCKSSCKNLHASLLCGFYVEIRHIARNLRACIRAAMPVACTVGGQCLGINKICTPKAI